jgi:hypothetical protein
MCVKGRVLEEKLATTGTVGINVEGPSKFTW